MNNDFLNTEYNSIVYSKTDYEDVNIIVPPINEYDFHGVLLTDEKKTENYGLRYTIRTNV